MNQVGTLARTPLRPLLLVKSAMRHFMTTVGQDPCLPSHLKNKISFSAATPSLHWSIGIDLRPGGRGPPAGHPTPPPPAEAGYCRSDCQPVSEAQTKEGRALEAEGLHEALYDHSAALILSGKSFTFIFMSTREIASAIANIFRTADTFVCHPT